MPLAQLTQRDGLLCFDCPRCQQPVAERFFGPSATCRGLLNEKFHQDPGRAPAVATERPRFEPKMNVVPNHVATKDDFEPDGPEPEEEDELSGLDN